jgi:hypothetical protein
MEIYRKLAEYNRFSADIGRRSDKQFRFNDSRYPEINRKIEKYINRTKKFPDFMDIKKQIEEANHVQQLFLSETQVISYGTYVV